MTIENDTHVFEQYRPQLIAVAYNMLGERAAAEDIVQEVWVKWHAVDKSTINTHAAWLTKVTTRIAIDSLRSARARRELYVGPWLPEPIMDQAPNEPERAFDVAKQCELAMLYAMERLTPHERSAFILRNVFDSDYDEIAQTLGKSEAACRKLVSRARTKINCESLSDTAKAQDISKVMSRFMHACQTMNHQHVLELLAPDVTAISDGGGKVRAALRPLVGQEEVCHVLLSIVSKYSADLNFETCVANNLPAIRVRNTENQNMIFTLRINQHAEIEWIYILRNPDKLNF